MSLIKFTQAIARYIAKSFLMGRCRNLWAKNLLDWNLPLTRVEKVYVGLYLILDDYGKGIFPKTNSSRDEVYSGEIGYIDSLPGLSRSEVVEGASRKPFWLGSARRYLNDFCDVTDALESADILPPKRILEIGCGCGWMSEQLALVGYQVTGTSIDPGDGSIWKGKQNALLAKGLSSPPVFVLAAMESVDGVLAEGPIYDAAFVYEALHHAYDWREAICSTARLLKPGGHLFIFKEPNLFHTFSAYRVAKLSNTHEIGFNPSKIITHLEKVGFTGIKFQRGKYHGWVLPVSIVARKL